MSKKALVNSIITIKGEKIQSAGEDHAFSTYDEPLGIISVFDGCGGIGAKKYPNQDNRSGAYLASRSAAKATEKWFSEISDFNRDDMENLSEGLKKCICSELNRLTDEDSLMKGSLVCEFPTTMSVVMFKQEKKLIDALFLWAGDSRGYVLDPDGLIQLTRDDIVGDGDAYINLREDARLSNFVSAKGNFFIRKRFAQIKPPAMLICATDGCFGYFSTPMEFEYMLLETLENSYSFAKWSSLIAERLKTVSGDDFSMHICMIGCSDIDMAKRVYKKRRKYLEKNYISKIVKADESVLEKLWSRYKENYYG